MLLVLFSVPVLPLYCIWVIPRVSHGGNPTPNSIRSQARVSGGDTWQVAYMHINHTFLVVFHSVTSETDTNNVWSRSRFWKKYKQKNTPCTKPRISIGVLSRRIRAPSFIQKEICCCSSSQRYYKDCHLSHLLILKFGHKIICTRMTRSWYRGIKWVYRKVFCCSCWL